MWKEWDVEGTERKKVMTNGSCTLYRKHTREGRLSANPSSDASNLHFVEVITRS